MGLLSIINCYMEHCDNKATNTVEKVSDLSHRKAHYCELHSKPYENYPNDFRVSKLK